MTEEAKACQTAIAAHVDSLVASTDGDAVQDGDMVTVDYVGRLNETEIFDTSVEAIATACGKYQEGRDYEAGLEFLVGQGQMIAGFEAAVKTMKVGESKTVTLAPADAYGERSEENVVEMPKSELPEGEWKVGDELPTFFGPMPITEVSTDAVKIDTNHPLAGETLLFDITVKGVQKAADVDLPSLEPTVEAIVEEVEAAVDEVEEAVVDSIVEEVEEEVEENPAS
jgi:FKBP-type peptidyl-prolyl cis-trans isomerase 2